MANKDCVKINKMSYAKTIVAKRFGTEKHYTSVPLSEAGLKNINTLKKRFTVNKNASHDPFVPRSEQRYMHLAKYHKDFLKGDIIDVGSRSSDLLFRLTGIKASLVDKHNKHLPDWDWEKSRVPASDGSYDSVICYDTLEHIDNLHEGFQDILRLSNNYVLVSLPNNWKKALNEFIKGRGRWASYGIPPEKPHDRHKWFFNTEDAEDFIYYHSCEERGNYEVVDVKYHIPKTIWRIKLLYPIFNFFLPEHYYKNLFVETIFFVLRKNK